MDLDSFIADLSLFQQIQFKRKQRGLNDYNPLLVVLKEHDEVRLHSRMLGSLLNPHALHYQGGLFLEKFLECFAPQGFTLDISKVTLSLEYNHIDIYLTDGEKHIILENKVYASDQKNQIQRYIDIVRAENPELCYENLLVIYLSIDRKEPSKYSLNHLEIKGSYIYEKEDKVAYFNSIHYRNESDLLHWLYSSQHEIRNVTNLNVSIQFYIDVIRQLIGEYQSVIDDYSSFFEEQERFIFFDRYQKEVLASISEEQDKLYEGYKQQKQKLENDYYGQLLGNFLEENSFLAFDTFRENKESNGGNILLIVFNGLYHLRLYMKKGYIVNMSIGMKENIENEEWIDIALIEEAKNRLELVNHYKTGRVKGVTLEKKIPIESLNINSLFETVSRLPRETWIEVQEHVNRLVKALGRENLIARRE